MTNPLLPTQSPVAIPLGTAPLGWDYRMLSPAARIRGLRDKDVWNIAIGALVSEADEYITYQYTLSNELEALASSATDQLADACASCAARRSQRALLAGRYQ